MSMVVDFQSHLAASLEEIKRQGLYKAERVISTPQGTFIQVVDATKVPPRVVFQRDLNDLGRGYTRSQLLPTSR